MDFGRLQCATAGSSAVTNVPSGAGVKQWGKPSVWGPRNFVLSVQFPCKPKTAFKNNLLKIIIIM